MKERKPRGYWTEAILKEEALKYHNISDLKKINKDAYNALHRKGLIGTLCSHMPCLKRSKFSKEFLIIESLKYNNRIDLKNSDESVYQAILATGNSEDFFAHMEPSKGIAYTFEELKEIALKYNTRIEFKKNNPTAHRAACRRDDYEEIVSHTKRLKIDRTLQEIQEKINLCTTHFEFREMYPKEYGFAIKHFDYGKISKKLKCSTRTSYPEKQLLNFIRNFHVNAKTLRDMKVKIEDKPHIKGFEIDIFVSELKLGIEFDGTYHHSYEGLRRSREHWPDEDIRNYHILKDSWFASKGIKILHIKQDEWKLNQEKCLHRCLSFLNGDLCP